MSIFLKKEAAKDRFHLITNKTFEQKSLKLIDVIKHINDNYYVLLQTQRGYVWKPKNVALLGDSLLKGLPIQQIITMPYNEKLTIGCRDLVGFNNTQVKPTQPFYILDGQQRLTSIGNLFLKDEGYYFNLFNIITQLYNQENISDSSDEVIFVEHLKSKKTKNPNYIKCCDVFNWFLTKQPNDIEKEFESRISEVLEKNNDKIDFETNAEYNIKNFATQYLYNMFNNMFNTDIGICNLSNSLDEEFLTIAFDRLNKEGVKLSIIDLIVNRTYNLTYNGVITEGIVNYIKKDIALYYSNSKFKDHHSSDDFLQHFIQIDKANKDEICFKNIRNLFTLMKLLVIYGDHDGVKNKIDSHSNLLSGRANLLTVDGIKWFEIWDAYKDRIFKIFEWLGEEKVKMFSAELLCIYTTLFLIDLDIDVNDNKNSKLKEWIVKVLAVGTVKGVGLGEDMKKDLFSFYQKIKTFKENILNNQNSVSSYKLDLKDLFVVKINEKNVLEATKKNNLGKLWYFMCKTQKISGLTDDLNGTKLSSTSNNFDLHHIIPHSHHKKEKKFNSIANLRLLDKNTNNAVIGNKKFHVYMSELSEHNKNFSNLVKMNLIPSNWKNLTEEEVLNEMAKLVANKINEYIFQ